MPSSGVSRAQENKRIRQDALREQLSSQGHVQHVIDNIIKMEVLDPAIETTPVQLNILKTANEQRLKLINKYLPDLKAVEIEGELGTRPILVDLSGGKLIQILEDQGESTATDS